MSEERLQRTLQAVSPPDELAAERRAWATARGAFAEREPGRARELPRRWLVVAALAAVVVAGILSPPGRAVAGWVVDAIGLERTGGRSDARPALISLPAPGRLLVDSPAGSWIVAADGSKRRLGPYSNPTWSPRGLHVAAARGRTLVALRPDGVVRWTLSRSGPVHHPAWSPSGFRIAYGVGTRLRLVHGDGAPDRILARNVAAGVWAWQRHPSAHLLAYGQLDGEVRLVDVDTRETVWVARLRRPPRAIAWTGDGRRLVVRTDEAVSIVGAAGRVLWTSPAGAPPSAGEQSVAAAPSGRAVAYVARDGEHGSAIHVLETGQRPSRPRVIFRGAGRLSDLAWSPDGRWLLVSWPSADQWVFLRMPGVHRIRAVANIEREFDPGSDRNDRRLARPTRLSGWCCP